jgi:hypothetical protein
MAQPSGRVCDAPENLAFLLRSSPIICVIDTFDILVQLLWIRFESWRTRKSWEDGYVNFLKGRFRDTKPDKHVEGSLANLRKNTAGRWMLFAFGTLPQLIKLYGVEGHNLIGAKVVGSMYLISFLVVEFIVVMPFWKKSLTVTAPENTPEGPRGAACRPYVAIGAGTVFDMYLLVQAFPLMCTWRDWHISESVGCIILTICGGVAIPSFLYMQFFITSRGLQSLTEMRYFISENWKPFWPLIVLRRVISIFAKHWKSFLLLLVTHGIPVAILFLFPKWKFPSDISRNCFCACIIGAWAALASNFAATMFAPIINETDSKPCRNLEKWLSRYYFILNLATCFLYFNYTYSPKGTVKPGWTEWLG